MTRDSGFGNYASQARVVDFLANGQFYDLSVAFTSHMQVPPAMRASNRLPTFETILRLEEHGIQAGHISTPIHCGTHLDAPAHVEAQGLAIDQLPLERFISFGYCIDLGGFPPLKPVLPSHLEAAASHIEPGMSALLHTGWSDRMWGADEYWRHSPYLSDEAAHWFVEQQVNIIGYDFFQEKEAKKARIDPDKFTTHRILLSAGILNLEHLTNLGPLAGKHLLLICLPLKIEHGDGSATRAVAILPKAGNPPTSKVPEEGRSDAG